MLLCFPVLGLSVFSAAAPSAASAPSFYLSSRGVSATGTETPEGLIVRTGSAAANGEVPSCHTYLRELRAALIANGVMKGSGEGYVFEQDYVFASPSTAAGVVLGRSSNGRVEWKLPDGRTLRAIQDAEASG